MSSSASPGSLLYEAKHGLTSKFKRIVEAQGDVDVNCRNQRGWTSLMLAARYGWIDIVKYLFESCSDTDINVHNGYNKTATYFAARLGHHEILGFLLEQNPCPAKVSLINQLGDNAFLAAAMHGHLECVRHLLQFEDKNLGGNHVLHSIHSGNEHEGKCAIQLAWENDNLEVVSYIAEFEQGLAAEGLRRCSLGAQLPAELGRLILNFVQTDAPAKPPSPSASHFRSLSEICFSEDLDEPDTRAPFAGCMRTGWRRRRSISRGRRREIRFTND
eukprot:113686_1